MRNMTFWAKDDIMYLGTTRSNCRKSICSAIISLPCHTDGLISGDNSYSESGSQSKFLLIVNWETEASLDPPGSRHPQLKTIQIVPRRILGWVFLNPYGSTQEILRVMNIFYILIRVLIIWVTIFVQT